ncbi:MAG: 2-hydroxyacid dehydrogenase [Streptosporangiales bacterium]|nr:2-hydroxyacid dehydrogenase [Streptosporangiales bacterium]
MAGKTTRILCAGDQFISPRMLAGAVREQAGDAEIVTHATDWPTTPWESGADVAEFLGDEDEIIDRAREADLLVTHLAPVTRRVLAAAPRLRAVAVCRGGPVNVDVAAATERGVPVLNLPGRNARAVAEFTIGLLIAGQRNIARSHAAMREGQWSGELYRYDQTGPELAGRTVGVVGLGQIGTRVAALLRPFGVRLLACDPYVDPDVATELGASLTGLDALCAGSDIVTLHARLTPETRHLIDAAALDRMREGAYLVNTARGALVDEAALVGALRSGHLSGAALDTYAREPLPAGSPLRTLDQVLAVSHLAGASTDVAERAARRIGAEAGRFLRGEPVANCVNPEVLPG